MIEQPFLRLIPLSIRENLECQKKCRLQDAGPSVRELNKRECKKGGPIALQPPQSESHCLSASMTEQPFLRLIPFSIRENLECQKKCRLQGAGSSVGELNKRECRKGGLIAFQPSQFKAHCLSISMTEQPFLRLIPLDIKEKLEKCRFRKESC